MGYTHYWNHTRAFTDAEWKVILAESKRIIAKAHRGLCSRVESDFQDADNDGGVSGLRPGLSETGASFTLPVCDLSLPRPGRPILVAGPSGKGKPRLSKHLVGLNGKQPHDYESFVLGKEPPTPHPYHDEGGRMTGFCKTEHRPYDAVVVSILAVAQKVAPDAIVASSDGGDAAIRYLF